MVEYVDVAGVRAPCRDFHGFQRRCVDDGPGAARGFLIGQATDAHVRTHLDERRCEAIEVLVI